MSYVIQASLSNPRRPECGQITISFPIATERYDQTMELLQSMGLGDVTGQDCKVGSVDSHYGVLGALEGTRVNVDQMDYLAKRLDSFCAGEDSQFQAMAWKLKLEDVKDLINLTFCCQQATVITDFSNLEAVGRSHYLNLNGGSVTVDELENLDGVETAWLLIDGGGETVTPYGVVYDNGMKLEQVYNGRQFPAYLYDNAPMALEITPKPGLLAGDKPEYLYLPASECRIQRTLLRIGETVLHDIHTRLVFAELPKKVEQALDLDSLTGDTIPAFNRMCSVIALLPSPEQKKLEEAIKMDTPYGPVEIRQLAEGLKDGPVQKAALAPGGAPNMIALTLTTAESWYYLTLPASEGKLADAKHDLGVERFDQAMISGVKYGVPNLERLIPTEGLTVEDANAVALCLVGMEQEKDGLATFRAALAVERPSTFTEVLNIVMDRDDYELVPEDLDEYGKQLLRAIGADDEIIDTIDGYMDFAQLGRDSLEEDGIRRTEFGLIKRLSQPFPPEPQMGPVMM